MILSNAEIELALRNKQIHITPSPLRPFDTTSLDLRLGFEFSIPKKEISVVLDPAQGSVPRTLETVYESRKLADGESLTLEPGNFMLGQTLERIQLPLRSDEQGYSLAARIEGKSSYARCGLLVHFTAPTIHAGFSGHIALEIINLGHWPIVLRPCHPVCQLIFELVKGMPHSNPSNFQGQSTPTGQ